MKSLYFLLLIFTLGLSAQPPSPDELKKLDIFVQRAQDWWIQVGKDFARENGIPLERIPKKLPTSFENEIRGWTRERLTKSFYGQFDWQTPMRSAYESYLLYKLQSRRIIIPGSVITLEREEEPEFDVKDLKLIALSQELWEKFRLMYLKKYGLKPEVISVTLPKHFKILVGKLDDSEVKEIEAQWGEKIKDGLFEAYLQYAEAHYYNTGPQTKRDIDARSVLEGKESAPIAKVRPPPISLVPKIEKKADIKEKIYKYGPYALVVILILAVILKR